MPLPALAGTDSHLPMIVQAFPRCKHMVSFQSHVQLIREIDSIQIVTDREADIEAEMWPASMPMNEALFRLVLTKGVFSGGMVAPGMKLHPPSDVICSALDANLGTESFSRERTSLDHECDEL